MSNLVKNPPFLFTYWNPLSENSSLADSWFKYVKDTSLAKYTADSVGLYLEQTSEGQIEAINDTSRRICGDLYNELTQVRNKVGHVSMQLGILSGQLENISGHLDIITSLLQGVNQRLDMVLDEARTSNLLLENIAEVLRIPDNQKQRQRHIEKALKRLKESLVDPDFYQDALRELLEAEKIEPDDYFVLHRIGIIYLNDSKLGNLEKAAEYFAKAGKYAAIESHPEAIRLVNILNKKISKRFSEQAEPTAASISIQAAESYYKAGTALYALGRFAAAAEMLEKAIKLEPKEPIYKFYNAKYVVRLEGKADLAVEQLREAISIAPEMAILALGDYDLNRSAPIIGLINSLSASVDAQLKEGHIYLTDWTKRQTLWAVNKPLSSATNDNEPLEYITATENTAVSLSDFIGQKKIKKELTDALMSLSREQLLGHVLFLGDPDVGKSTLAKSLANTMGRNIRVIDGTEIYKISDLIAIGTSLKESDVLLIKNIECLEPDIMEYLYTAMKEFHFRINIDEEDKSVSLKLPRFTLIGTAFSKEDLPQDLIQCFSAIYQFEPYTREECVAIGKHGYENAVCVDSAAGNYKHIVDLDEWLTKETTVLENGSYPAKVSLISLFNRIKGTLDQIDLISAIGLRFNIATAFELLKQDNHDHIINLSSRRICFNYITEPKLALLKYAPERQKSKNRIIYETLFATADEIYFEATGEVKWIYPAETNPALSNTGLIFVGVGNNLYAVDRETVNERWIYKADGPIGDPIVGDCLVFFAAGNHINALECETGRRIWTHPRNGRVNCISGDGNIICNTKSEIFVLEGRSGRELWNYPMRGEYECITIVAGLDQTVYIGADNIIIAIKSDSGDELWAKKVIISESLYSIIDDEGIHKSNDGNSYTHWYTRDESETAYEKPFTLIFNKQDNSLIYTCSLRTTHVEHRCYNYTHQPDDITVDSSRRRPNAHEHYIVSLSADDGRKQWEHRIKKHEGENLNESTIVLSDSALYIRCENKAGTICQNKSAHKINVCNALQVVKESTQAHLSIFIQGIAIGYDCVYFLARNYITEEASLFSLNPASGGLQRHDSDFYTEFTHVSQTCPIIIGDNGMIYIKGTSEICCIYSNCERGPETIWPMFRQNPQGTGCSIKPHIMLPTQEEIDQWERVQVELHQRKVLQEKLLVILKHRQAERSARRARIEGKITELMEEAKRIQDSEMSKWFRKKDFSKVNELNNQADHLRKLLEDEQ